MRNQQKNYSLAVRGFSLVEILVSVAVFSIIIAAVTYVFSRSSVSFKTTRYMQRDLEGANQALNLMAKSLRTSSVYASTSQRIDIYDYSQDKCIGYQFNSNTLQTRQSNSSMPAGARPEEWCPSASFGDWSAMIDAASGNFISGNFSASSSTRLPNPSVGKVTVSLSICSTAGCSGSPNDQVRIQSTVSLRDYSVSGIL